MSSSVCVSHRNWFWMRNNISEDIFPLLRMFLFLSPTAQPRAGPAAFRHKHKRRARASVLAAEGRPRGSRGSRGRGAAALSPLRGTGRRRPRPGRAAGAPAPPRLRAREAPAAAPSDTPHHTWAALWLLAHLPSPPMSGYQQTPAGHGLAARRETGNSWRRGTWLFGGSMPFGHCCVEQRGQERGAPPRGKAGKDTAAGTM